MAKIPVLGKLTHIGMYSVLCIHEVINTDTVLTELAYIQLQIGGKIAIVICILITLTLHSNRENYWLGY